MPISGNNVKVQFGVESTYGTAPTLTNQVKVFTEGMKYNPSKKEEGLLTGLRSTGRTDTMAIATEGALSFLMRPDDGAWLALALGVEKAVTTIGTTSYKHTFDAIDSTASLPSVTIAVDRGTGALEYTGNAVATLAFAAAPEDYLKLDVAMVGREEESGDLNDSLNPSPLKAFKFRQAKVKIGNEEVADVTDIKFNYDNALTSNQQTTSTGAYFMKPEPGPRNITAELEVVYSANSEALRNTYFKADDEVSLEIVFESDEIIETIAGEPVDPGDPDGPQEPDTVIPYSLRFFLPHTQITECSANVGGADMIKQTMTLQAFESVNGLVEVELVNSRETKYTA